nr:CGNR zinc finger domain-containing protein [Actinomadura sp. RB99]
MFTGIAAGRIRGCASPECALLFVDTSRLGRRRWCSSAACGSKDRSAAYRRRQAGRVSWTAVSPAWWTSRVR